MNILIVGLNYYPERTGIGVYTSDFARFLVQRGHSVEAITTFPYYPQWKRSDGYTGKLFSREAIDGVSVFRCSTYVPRNPTSLKRVLHEAIFSLFAFIRVLLVSRPDVIIAVSPPFAAMFACAVASRIKRTCFHIHIQDLQPDAAFDLGMLKSAFLRRLLYSMERFSYRSAHLVSAIGETMLEKIRSKGVPGEKLFLFPNWVTGAESVDDAALPPEVETLSEFLDGRFVVLYAGSMGEKQGLDTLIATAEIAGRNDEDIKFVLVGDGSQRRTLQSLSERKNLSNMRFVNVLPQEAFMKLLRRADASVILQRPEVRDVVVPSKLMNILAVGSPVVAAVSRDSETANILSSLSVETVVSPGDSEALYRKIVQFKTSPDSLTLLRQEEQSLAKRLFDRETILTRASERIESAVRAFDRRPHVVNSVRS